MPGGPERKARRPLRQARAAGTSRPGRGRAARVEEAGAVPGAGADGVTTGPGAAALRPAMDRAPASIRPGSCPIPASGWPGPGRTPRADAAAAVAGRAGPAPWPRGLATGWPLRRIFGIGVLIAGLFAVLAITLGGAALANLAGARDRVVGKLDPAAFRHLATGDRVPQPGNRGPWLRAQRAAHLLKTVRPGPRPAAAGISALRRLLAGMPAASADLAQVIARADTWRSSYAEPTIRQVTARGSQSSARLRAGQSGVRQLARARWTGIAGRPDQPSGRQGRRRAQRLPRRRSTRSASASGSRCWSS
jgi:hypothetical protein